MSFQWTSSPFMNGLISLRSPRSGGPDGLLADVAARGVAAPDPHHHAPLRDVLQGRVGARDHGRLAGARVRDHVAERIRSVAAAASASVGNDSAKHVRVVGPAVVEAELLSAPDQLDEAVGGGSGSTVTPKSMRLTLPPTPAGRGAPARVRRRPGQADGGDVAPAAPLPPALPPPRGGDGGRPLGGPPGWVDLQRERGVDGAHDGAQVRPAGDGDRGRGQRRAADRALRDPGNLDRPAGVEAVAARAVFAAQLADPDVAPSAASASRKRAASAWKRACSPAVTSVSAVTCSTSTERRSYTAAARPRAGSRGCSPGRAPCSRRRRTRGAARRAARRRRSGPAGTGAGPARGRPVATSCSRAWVRAMSSTGSPARPR